MEKEEKLKRVGEIAEKIGMKMEKELKGQEAIEEIKTKAARELTKEELDKLAPDKEDLEEFERKALKKLERAKEYDNKIAKALKDIEFLKKHTHCLSCHMPMLLARDGICDKCAGRKTTILDPN